MSAETANAILSQWGAFGAVLIISWIALGWWILKLQNGRERDQKDHQTALKECQAELAALHALRAAELHGVTDRVMKLAEAHNFVQQSQATATNAVADRLDDLLLMVRDLAAQVANWRGGGARTRT